MNSSSIKDEIIKLCFQTNYPLDVQGWGGGGMGVDATPHKVFLSFFPEDKTSAPEVFSSCSFISRTDFEIFSDGQLLCIRGMTP